MTLDTNSCNVFIANIYHIGHPTVNEPVEFETCVDRYPSLRASVNESWRGGGWRVSQQLIESEPGFIVVMGDLGYRSARSRIKRPEKLREIQLQNLGKYTYKARKKPGKCCLELPFT